MTSSLQARCWQHEKISTSKLGGEDFMSFYNDQVYVSNYLSNASFKSKLDLKKQMFWLQGHIN